MLSEAPGDQASACIYLPLWREQEAIRGEGPNHMTTLFRAVSEDMWSWSWSFSGDSVPTCLSPTALSSKPWWPQISFIPPGWG